MILRELSHRRGANFCGCAAYRSKLGLSLTADSFGGVGAASTAPKVERGSEDEIFNKIRAMQESSML